MKAKLTDRAAGYIKNLKKAGYSCFDLGPFRTHKPTPKMTACPLFFAQIAGKRVQIGNYLVRPTGTVQNAAKIVDAKKDKKGRRKLYGRFDKFGTFIAVNEYGETLLEFFEQKERALRLAVAKPLKSDDPLDAIFNKYADGGIYR